MASATAIHLKDTNHVVTAFTRQGTDDGKLSDEQLLDLFERPLTLRHLPQSPLTPAPNPATLKKNAPHEIVIEAEELSAFGESLENPIQDFVKRPTDFSVVDGKLEAIASRPIAFDLDSLKYALKSDGLDLTLAPKSSATISEELNVTVFLRIEQNVVHLKRSGKIETAARGDPAKGKVTFPTIQTGTHFLVLMIDGFHPIWDELPTAGPNTRTWT